ncbi:MAG: DUF1049 domain-containing protein [Alphaproteobacteria bacterium]|nr:DUF1049 domain-containing protein [Alphaproteobacteria bacterium]MBU6472295.1 DUF1049 domain-containing protein [Alphaproteobacteria bacterium]MDE2013801.1 LapA family protein [Alphaproteobacteria bacterium]MDE2352632.1 LapA family protein [Alphaproteobacteria bacterium]
MRLSSFLLGAPVVVVAAVVAVANRQTVRFSLDPFTPAAFGLAFDIPLFVLLFAALGLGAVLGVGAALLSRAGRSASPGAKTGRSLLPKLGGRPKPPASE